MNKYCDIKSENGINVVRLSIPTQLTSNCRIFASTLDNINDIVNGINRNKKITIGYLKQLSSFKMQEEEESLYKTFYIKKKSGGVRTISAPNRSLKNVQICINKLLESSYSPSDFAFGFISGRSVVDNAQCHIGHNYVFNIDLKDFFTSIDKDKIYSCLRSYPFRFSLNVALLIQSLVTVWNNEIGKFVLPQGAPCSPLLTNIVCRQLDYKLSQLANKYDITYSRYADDITFSSNHNIYGENGSFIGILKNIIKEEGFSLNDKKTRLLKSGTRQEVTGLTVNSKVNVTRKYVKQLRYLIYLCEHYDLPTAYAVFIKFYRNDKSYVKKGNPNIKRVILGKLNYLKMVKGCDDSTYLSLQKRYDNIKAFHKSHMILVANNIFPQEKNRSSEIKEMNEPGDSKYDSLHSLVSYPYNVFIKLFNLKNLKIEFVGDKYKVTNAPFPIYVGHSYSPRILRKRLWIVLFTNGKENFWVLYKTNFIDRGVIFCMDNNGTLEGNSYSKRCEVPAIKNELKNVLNDLFSSLKTKRLVKNNVIGNELNKIVKSLK